MECPKFVVSGFCSKQMPMVQTGQTNKLRWPFYAEQRQLRIFANDLSYMVLNKH
uniref:Uncharacterized protein n=1 Tax=Candidatus Kentrum eta TaxID=2126337 RepID=A0A450UFX0_9GAMM|nr:MAG: hypothetical protein BECKH772B_GA0070898_100185 [Candidatus Kentron sp. H]VFJ91914.1 MAG: hypothetical protein BECKH772A_GA0070896_100365 [Candidatus Kentron sp. H]VFJ99752.1 MAG: hypothetical protein BECKH772C_GA0070978_100354 [Candidatus Kentron sp. H]